MISNFHLNPLPFIFGMLSNSTLIGMLEMLAEMREDFPPKYQKALRGIALEIFIEFRRRGWRQGN